VHIACKFLENGQNHAAVLIIGCIVTLPYETMDAIDFWLTGLGQPWYLAQATLSAAFAEAAFRQNLLEAKVLENPHV